MSAPWIAAFASLWTVVLLLGLLVLGTLRRILPLLEQAEQALATTAAELRRRGLAPGARVPAFSAAKAGGGSFTDTDLRAAASVVLFLDPSCPACERLAADVEAGAVPALGAQFVVVSDDAEQARSLAAGNAAIVLFDEDRSLARGFESDRTPHAFVIDKAGRVTASGMPNDWEALRRLLTETEEGGGREIERAAAAVAS